MENANKALFIAIGVLMGVIILSLGVFLYYSLGGYITSTQDKMELNANNSFNQQFYAFTDRKDITIQEVISVANLAHENNLKYGLTAYDSGKSNYVRVGIKDGTVNYGLEKPNSEKSYDQTDLFLLSEYAEDHFRCYRSKLKLSTYTGRCCSILFTKI